MQYQPHDYQAFALRHILDNPASALLLDMGLGKTVITLTAINELVCIRRTVAKVLVIAPKKVAEHTWTTETAKWSHLRHLKISTVLGSASQRKRALAAKADIYVINRENVCWLVSEYGTRFPFDMVVIDELSSFKSAKAARFKALRTMRPRIKRVVGLTGTPMPNGLLDLWPQLYLLDMGERLGKTITSYRTKYFSSSQNYAASAAAGYAISDYNLLQGDSILGPDIYEKEIFDKINDICISMKAKDYLNLPKRIDIITEVVLPPSAMNQYLEFEKRHVLELFGNGNEITAVNAAALTGKLLQFANGAVYDSEKSWHVVHSAKLDVLEERLEAMAGKSLLVAYWFKHDLERLLMRFKTANPAILRGPADIEAWNAGKIRLLFAHPASAGHGLNLQQGGHHIEWFGNTWSRELYDQFNGRLDRQGQTSAVINSRMVAKGTIDEDVIAAQNYKGEKQDMMMEAVKARILKYSNN